MKPQNKKRIIPHGYYSYYSAILAVEILMDKISDCCEAPPKMVGALAERKNAVQKIEIQCVPKLYRQQVEGELLPETRNCVLDLLGLRYKDIVPDNRHDITEASFTYMSIPCTIHFKHNASAAELVQ